MLKLRGFVIENFRSIVKTEEITLDQTCVIVGVNEAGKSNALLGLCRTNPANSELAINRKDDIPRTLYNQYEAAQFKKQYCVAKYEVSEAFIARIQGLYKWGKVSFDTVEVTSYFDGDNAISVAGWKMESISDAQLLSLIDSSLHGLSGVKEIATGTTTARVHQLAELLRNYPEKEKMPELAKAVSSLEEAFGVAKVWESDDYLPAELLKEIKDALPKFIYFTRYGSLESFVHLERYIQNRDQQGGLSKQDREKHRTIAALFKFTGIDPIDLRNKAQTGATADKDLRQIKLGSGSSRLTQEFNSWWKQLETKYRFTFTLDGDYFRIWVEDNRASTPIELENRSAGLQWFLGFFVTFLVESEDAHKNAVLLLDEPGVTLHPTAQRDLIEFFKSLGDKNQIIYTTHSPFLIDNQNIDNVVAAFLNEKGETKVTKDLGEAGKKTTKRNSVYPVHAALGLSVANTFLADSKPIFVEGASDQILLSAFLAALRRIKIFANTDSLFIPFGGTNSLPPILRLLASSSDKLIPVLLDADEAGRKIAQDLTNGLYQKSKDQIVLLSKVSSKPNVELEDLVPLDIFNDAVDRYFAAKLDGKTYEALTDETKSFVDHVEKQAPGDWKVEVAGHIKHRLKQGSVISQETAEKWRKLLESVFVEFTVATHKAN